MRIVHVLTRLLRAGSEENTLLTAAGQIAEGHDVILLHGRDVLAEHALHHAPGARLIGAESLTRDLNPGRDLAAFREVRSILLRLRPDVVHTHQSKAGIVGRLAASSAHVPLIVHGVHILPFLGVSAVEKVVYLWSEHAAARVTHGFIHVSEGMRRACLDHKVGAGRAHFVVRSGFDLTGFATALPPDDWHQIVRAAPGTKRPQVIAMLAALEPRKHHVELLRHAAPFLRENPEVRLVFAGEGYLRAEIEATVQSLGLCRQVTLLGFRTDPERIIAMADVCIHCAEREGLPRSVLQYLAGGRPVVLFDLPGIEEAVTNGRNGFVVPQEDWTAFFERLSLLLSMPQLRAAMAADAKATPLAQWNASLMAKRTLAIYAELQAHARSAGSAIC